jgi:hypothetical protein
VASSTPWIASSGLEPPLKASEALHLAEEFLNGSNELLREMERLEEFAVRNVEIDRQALAIQKGLE